MYTYGKIEDYNRSHSCLNIHVDVNHRKNSHLMSDIIVCALDIGLMFVAILANVLAIIAYRRNSALQTPSNYLLMILSIVDIVLASTAQPLFFIWKVLELAGTFSCVLYLCTVLLINFLGAISFLLTSFLLSIERYLSVFHPLFHRKHASKRVFKVAFLLISTIWLVFLLLMFISKNPKVYFAATALLVALCLTGTIASYRRILHKISRRCSHRMMSVKSITDHRQRCGRLRREKATLINMAFVIAAMTLLYSPIGGCVVYANLIGRDWLYMNYLLPWAYILVFINNAIHPFLYGWKTRGMRQSINGVIRSVLFEETHV